MLEAPEMPYILLEDDGTGTNMQGNGDLGQMIVMIGDGLMILGKECHISTDRLLDEIKKYINQEDEEINVSKLN